MTKGKIVAIVAGIVGVVGVVLSLVFRRELIQTIEELFE